MFCPDCRIEYRPGFTRCSDCDVDLVYELPKSGYTKRPPDMRGVPDPDLQLESVFKSADPALCLIAESVLRGAEIEFVAQMRELEETMSADPTLGRHHTYEYWVAEDDAEEARDLLEDLEHAGPLDEDADLEAAFDDEEK